MHIPDHALTSEIAIASSVLCTATLVTSGIIFLRKGSEEIPSLLRFAGLAAVIFSLQMLNFPVSHGTSGHFLGGALAVSLCGWAGGILLMGIVLGVQTLVFGDGGVTALGGNFLTMALAAGTIGLLSGGSKAPFIMMGATAALSVLVAVALCSTLIVLSGSGRAEVVFPAMFFAHLPVAFLEGALTAILVWLVETKRLTDLKMAILALVCALVVAPFASSFPDGLESALSEAGHAETEPVLSALLQDYTIPALGDSPISVSLAAIIGIIAVMVLAFGVNYLARCQFIVPKAK